MAVNLGKKAGDSSDTPKKKKTSFLNKGADAARVFQEDEARAEAARENGAFRFFIPKKALNDDFRITFLDGDLTEDGRLDVPNMYEHGINHNGRFQQFVCVNHEEPCPMCEAGDKPSLVHLFTIIDHSEYTDKNGNVHKDERRLYAVKKTAMKSLMKLAEKRGGLTGSTFDVSRTGEKEPATGNMFDFQSKATKAELKKAYGDNAEPFDYGEVIIYRTAAELTKLGLGANVGSIGGETDEDVSGEL